MDVFLVKEIRGNFGKLFGGDFKYYVHFLIISNNFGQFLSDKNRGFLFKKDMELLLEIFLNFFQEIRY